MSAQTAIMKHMGDLGVAGPLGSFDAYVERVSRVPVLSREDEQRLARQFRDHDDLDRKPERSAVRRRGYNTSGDVPRRELERDTRRRRSLARKNPVGDRRVACDRRSARDLRAADHSAASARSSPSSFRRSQP